MLESMAVRPSTKKYYSILLKNFMAFALALGGFKSDDEMDACLVDYSDYLFFEGYPGSMGGKLLAAIMDELPHFSRSGQGRLPRFSRSLRAWGRLAPGRSRDPLPWLHVVGIVLTLIAWRAVDVALWVILAFTTYFRPSEMMSIKIKDLVYPTRTVSHFSIQLHPFEDQVSSKVGLFDDGVPLDGQNLPWLGNQLVYMVRKRPPHTPMFTKPYVEIKSLFEKACGKLQIKDQCLYRLRHGGASHDRATGARPLDAVKKRGRWAAGASVKRYEKSVRLQQVESELPAQ